MEQASQFSPESAVSALHRAMEVVNNAVVNRSQVVTQICLALLCGEHALIQSRTGAAKSLLAKQIFAAFDDASVFMVQASKEQQPDTYFGGLDLEELKKGRLIHNTEKSLVESDLAFIDEIFDANDYTLRALLTTLNERMLIRGVQHVPARIHTVIAATNYLRISEVTEAVLDRFLFKSVIVPERDLPHQYQIARAFMAHHGQVVKPADRMRFTDLQRLSAIVRGMDPVHAISVSDDLVFFMNVVIRLYEVQANRHLREHPDDHPHMKELYISPRTRSRAIDCLRAVALLNGTMDASRQDVVHLWRLFTTVGMTSDAELFRKCHQQALQQFTATRAFDQLILLLDFQRLLERLRAEPRLIQQPVTGLEATPLRRTLLEWAREKLGLADATVQFNQRLLEGFIKSVSPATEELQELKTWLEREAMSVFQERRSVLD